MAHVVYLAMMTFTDAKVGPMRAFMNDITMRLVQLVQQPDDVAPDLDDDGYANAIDFLSATGSVRNLGELLKV